ncbi:anti-sigma factor antagonist [Candidatus Mycobacterium methanotrophicum]|uniref:Anti-sigma factor antagonist n=1 Tax=Candidatus Mycobacterium methanotrophicum TaxID=2943498 RepID=A0ABY4QKD2_9MYCO|nr:anti-sigma factor antagonist [Candidatus Mycobacterium methanotrophicum]UQX10296.1 anti-sigma factor antagonist [Candidatus Mycobacterium methanotrophicum]
MNPVRRLSVSTPPSRPPSSFGEPRPLRGGSTGLRATSVRDGSAVIVSVAGEVDASNEDFWSHLLSKMGAAATAPGPFVVDVRGLRFLACGAFPILAREAQRCRRRGFNLHLVSNRAAIARTAAACGLRPVLLIFPTVRFSHLGLVSLL